MNRDGFLDKFQKIPVDVYLHRTHTEPLVSVCVQTYQHVNFIKDCIDGILMQKTDFPFEILLGEDDSTDGTREVCINYAEKYPDKIRLFLHHRGNNIKINGMPTGRFNFMYNLLNARGKYIALCEGDDYWTDSYKLQKQVDFLDNKSDFSLCFHDMRIVDDNCKYIRSSKSFEKESLTIDDLIEGFIKGRIVHTASCVYRNRINKFPRWFYKGAAGDYLLFILIGQHGKFGYLNETMGVYREHSAGIWSGKSDIYRIKNMAYIFKSIYKFLKQTEYRTKLGQICFLHYYHLANIYKKEKDFINAFNCSLNLFFFKKYKSNKSLDIILELIILHFPRLYKFWKLSKNLLPNH